MTAYTLKGHNWCPYCMRQMKALHSDGNERTKADEPRHGDIGICRGCGHTVVISRRSGASNALWKPSDYDWEWIETSESYQRLLARHATQN